MHDVTSLGIDGMITSISAGQVDRHFTTSLIIKSNKGLVPGNDVILKSILIRVYSTRACCHVISELPGLFPRRLHNMHMHVATIVCVKFRPTIYFNND